MNIDDLNQTLTNDNNQPQLPEPSNDLGQPLVDLVDALQSVDTNGGLYFVAGQTITLAGRSSSLNLPWTREAREKSDEIFRAQSPGYEVIVEPVVSYKELNEVT